MARSPAPDAVSFRALRCFNDPELRPHAGSRERLDARTTARFAPDDPVGQVVGALEGLLPLKEVCESFEFFERVRKKARGPVVVDLAAGHGLTGLLFGVFERSVERVLLVDIRPSPSSEAILEALGRVAPWLPGKVTWRADRIESLIGHLEPGASVVAVHACGHRTDRCLDAALAAGGPVAVLPCCHPKRGEAPAALYQALGPGLAEDIHRTYRLEAAGYQVRWTRIPEVISPKNRVLVGRPPTR